MKLHKDQKKPSTPSAVKALIVIIVISAVLLLLLFGSMACTMTQSVEINTEEDGICVDEKAVRGQVIIGNTVECNP